ncbi:MAG: trehalose-phosphatase [Sphingomicrobium sp.]
MASLPPPPLRLLHRSSLFLDFDGTLVDFVIDPDAAPVDQRLRILLGNLAERLDGRLAIHSGRSLDELTTRLGLGEIAMAGSHGLERRSAGGTVTRAPIPPELATATEAARAFAATHGLLLETKAAGVALHYRDARHAEAAVDRFARALAADTGLDLQSGKCVRELKVPGADKGDAVRAFMAEPPFHLGRPVVMGDDLTDEHAFEAAIALGGSAILVGDARQTAAGYRLPTVEATLAWLSGSRA